MFRARLVMCVTLASFVAACIPTPLAAQQPSVDTTRRFFVTPQLTLPPIYKDADLAPVLSFVMPGAGQMYAGKQRTGLALFGASVVALRIAVQPCGNTNGCSSNTNTWLLVGATAWVYGIVTAARDAHEFNDRLLRETGAAARPASR